jgi:hypothetical protein
MKIYQAGANEILTSTNLKTNFMEIGFNTGNMAIARGVTDLIIDNFGSPYMSLTRGDEIHDEDILVIGAANWISKSVDLSWLLNLQIEKFSRILVLGLGIQNLINDLSEMSPTANNFIDILIRKNAVVCTRDKITEKILKLHVKKLFWTGCPSLRLKSPPCIESRIPNSIAYGGSVEVITHAKNSPLMAKFEASILKNMNNSDIISYILQAEYPIMEAINLLEYGKIGDYLKMRFGINSSDIVTNKFNYYFSINQWMEALSKADYFIGTRLHGNILAWKSGSKPFLIAHDIRTNSFLEDFKFPGYELTSEKSLQQVLEDSLQYTYDEFYEQLHKTEGNLKEAFTQV